MIHLPDLIQDLGVILIVGAIVTLICKILKQPVVLGYLIAGFLVGPDVPFLPSVTETKSVKVWAEIGVIFLLFSLGLEFSFKKLAQVGRSATITALFEIVVMLGVGYLVGQALGWSRIDSIFLGGILSISSTTIIVRAFQEQNLKGRNFVNLVFGVLIVEDLVAILLLVLLTSVAVSQSFSGFELAYSAGRLGFFMVLWFVLGIYLVPYFLNKAKRHLADETMLVVALGLCLFMVMIATQVGFSPALGAFVMGSIFSETREGKRIEHLFTPVRDLFGAIFFVSVGMLIELNVLKEHFGVVVLLTVVTIFGKLMSSTVGALISGRSLKNSVQAGMSLAQIGEFSFIIATLGLTLEVTSDFLYPIAVAVSAITTFTTPYMIRYADPFYFWIDKKLPPTIRERLERYEKGLSSESSTGLLQLLWEGYGFKVLVNSILTISITLVISRALNIFVETQNWMTQSLGGGLTIALTTPFLWAIVFSSPSESVQKKIKDILLLRRLQIGIQLVRFLFGSLLILFVLSQFIASFFVVSGLLVVISSAGVFFSRYAEPFYKKMEDRFVENLNQRERDALERSAMRPELAPWNASLQEFIVHPDSAFVMKNFLESGVKEKFGITIAMIQRGSKKILAPGRDDIFIPYDKIFAIGTDEQLAPFRKIVENGTEVHLPSSTDEFFGLTSFEINESHSLLRKTIRESGLRENASGLVVGIERSGQRLLNPDSNLTFELNDLVWIVGDLKKIRSVLVAPKKT